jgi:hypothetical protein
VVSLKARNDSGGRECVSLPDLDLTVMMTTTPGAPSSALSPSISSTTSSDPHQGLQKPTISPLPPLPPLPPPSLSLQPSKRPSTAPGLPLAQDPHNPPQLSGFAATRASVRKTPTLSNLFDIKQSKRSNQLHLGPPSSQTLSPTSPAVRSTVSQSSSQSDRRSSSTRRPPASFSANGIETAYGPPPALITRSSSYHSEILRAQNPAASALAAQQQKPYNSSTLPPHRNSSTKEKSRDKLADWAQQKSQFPLPSQTMASRTMDSLDAVVHQNRSWTLGPTSHNSFGSSELSPRDPRRQTFRQNSDEGMESSQSSEDLFLKLGNDRTEDSETAELTARLDHMHVSIPIRESTSIAVSLVLVKANLNTGRFVAGPLQKDPLQVTAVGLHIIPPDEIPLLLNQCFQIEIHFLVKIQHMFNEDRLVLHQSSVLHGQDQPQ